MFNLSDTEFLDVIQNNPNFEFTRKPQTFIKSDEHSCSYAAYIPKGSSVYFHNFDLNGSYHVQFWGTSWHILSYNKLFNDKIVSRYFKHKVGLIFKDEIYENIKQGLSTCMQEIKQFTKLRPAAYKSIMHFNIELYFDKETHVYCGYKAKLSVVLNNLKCSMSISPMLVFELSGSIEQPVSIKMPFPLRGDKYKSPFSFSEKIPESVSVLHHWIARCRGDENATISDALDGLERLDMKYKLKEMQAY